MSISSCFEICLVNSGVTTVPPQNEFQKGLASRAHIIAV